MLSTISQRKTNTGLTFLWNPKNQTHRNRGRMVAAKGWGGGDGEMRCLQIPSYKMSKFLGSNVQRGDYS